jgi:hypothetical protein
MNCLEIEDADENSDERNFLPFLGRVENHCLGVSETAEVILKRARMTSVRNFLRDLLVELKIVKELAPVNSSSRGIATAALKILLQGVVENGVAFSRVEFFRSLDHLRRSNELGFFLKIVRKSDISGGKFSEALASSSDVWRKILRDAAVVGSVRRRIARRRSRILLLVFLDVTVDGRLVLLLLNSLLFLPSRLSSSVGSSSCDV